MAAERMHRAGTCLRGKKYSFTGKGIPMGKKPVVGFAGLFLAGAVLCGCQEPNKAPPPPPKFMTPPDSGTRQQIPPGGIQGSQLGQPQSGNTGLPGSRPLSMSSGALPREQTFGGQPVWNGSSDATALQKPIGGSLPASSGAIRDPNVTPAGATGLRTSDMVPGSSSAFGGGIKDNSSTGLTSSAGFGSGTTPGAYTGPGTDLLKAGRLGPAACCRLIRQKNWIRCPPIRRRFRVRRKRFPVAWNEVTEIGRHMPVERQSPNDKRELVIRALSFFIGLSLASAPPDTATVPRWHNQPAARHPR